MKIKLMGLVMAIFCCISMVGGSFAAAPASSDVSKVSSGYNDIMFPTQITGLYDQVCKVGQTAKFSGKLQHNPNNIGWVNGIWRYMTIKVYNNKNVEVYSNERMNNIFTAVGHFDVDTRKLNLNPGKYTVVMSYGGNDRDCWNPCDATATLTVTP